MHRNLILFLTITLFFLTSCEEGFDLKSGITISEKNELYTLELNVSTNTTEDLSPIQFNARVIRNVEFSVRSDSKVIGYWSLYSLAIDSVTENVAQYPTDYEFYDDNTFDKIHYSTVGGSTVYQNGGWNADMSLGTFAITLLNETTHINISFDSEADIVPLDGFMIWNYEKDGKAYQKGLQKSESTNPGNLIEPESYLSIAATGGTLEGMTEASPYDILIQLPNNINSTYEVSGSFVPSIDFYEGNLLATLTNQAYTVVNVSITISIEITIY